MTDHARVTETGEVVFSLGLAAEMGWQPGEELTAARKGSNLVVKTYAEIVREGQAAFAAMIKQPFTVDEFLAERRAEAARE